MRKLLLLASTMIFLDVVFFSAIAPLLPEYADDLGLSDAQAGILSASYAAGTLLAALPAGLVASQVGPRKTVIVGLSMLGVASLAFGLAEQIVLLDVARFIQGVAGALVWSGALTWLITTAPDEKRGSVIGTALGTAVAGALLGPALGALAGSVGTAPVFGSVLLDLAAARLRWPRECPKRARPSARTCARSGRRSAAARSSTPSLFVAVPSTMFGAIEVLVPLRIDDLGGSHGVIAAGFIVGAGLEAILAPIAGRISDRVGRRLPYVAGLSICAVAMLDDRPRAGARGRARRPDHHLARRRALLRAGADPALRRRRVERPAPGLRRRALEHGLGLGPGDRRYRRRRRRHADRRRRAQRRRSRCCSC